ncbi:MAG: Arm DNA-binding domain-containing protein [Desertimonas sp.]
MRRCRLGPRVGVQEERRLGVPSRPRCRPADGRRRQSLKQGFATKREAEAGLRALQQAADRSLVVSRSSARLEDDLGEWIDTASSIGRCTVPGMMPGAVDHPRSMEITGCQAHRCRCPNARRSSSR